MGRIRGFARAAGVPWPGPLVPSALASMLPWASAWLALVLCTASARAGDYHSESTLHCNDCHVMHFSQSHGYNGLGSGRTLAGVPQRALLASPINDLCLTCHDGSTLATDVLDSVNSGSQTGIVRTAGYLNRLGSASAHGGHTLDSLAIAPGSQPSWSAASENGTGIGLQCTNCHDPHGATNFGHPTGRQYRNLRDNPGTASRAWVTYNATPGVNDLSRDVFVREARNYDETEMDWNEPDRNASAIARWCQGCHSATHGDFGSQSGGLSEHPFEGEDLESDMLTRYNSLTTRVKLMSEFGVWAPAGRDVTPTCITCHRAHGNANSFGLIYRSGTGLATEDGDTGGSNQGNLCRQCHDSPSPFVSNGPLIPEPPTQRFPPSRPSSAFRRR